MKRSELKVGDELYWATPGDWKGDYTGKKVTVLHVEPYGRAEFGRREIRKEYDGKGNGVHVRVDHASFGYGEEIVRLGDLRGPYAAVLAEVEARQVAARLAEIEARTARRAAGAARVALVDRARAAGYGFAHVGGLAMEGRVMTTVETLGAMLDRIDALIADVADLESQISNLRDDTRATSGYGERS